MKKTVAVMLLCLLGVFAFAVTSFAETTEDGLFDYEILTDSENEDLVYAQITKYNGEIGGDLTLPDELGGYPVMTLGRGLLSFDNKTSHVGTMRLPKHLYNFFINEIFQSVERYSADADSDYISVDEAGALYSSDGTEFYSYPVFSPVKEYRIADSVSTIYVAGRYTRYLERMIIPGSVETIPGIAFYKAENLREVILEEGVREIAANCTGDCESMERFVLPSTLTKIGNNGLSGLRKVKELVIPASVDHLGYGALNDNNVLERVVFLGVPDRADTGGQAMFQKDPLLSDIYYVGSEDEWNASPISAMVPDGVQMHFGARYAAQNDVMIDYDDGMLSLKGGAVNGGSSESLFPWDFYAGDCETISFGSDVNRIGENAFRDFASLSEIVIYGDGVTVEKDAFAGCDKLTTIVAFGGVRFEDGALPAGVRVYIPDGADFSGNGISPVRFSASDGVLTLNGTINTDAYTFLDLAAVFCDRFGEIGKIKVSSLRLDDVKIYYLDENGKKKRLEHDILTDGEITVGITETDGDREITFNELCAGIADGTIESFFFTTATEEHGENIDTPVEIVESEEELNFFQRVLKAIVTLLNRLFNFLKNLGKK